MQIFRPGAGPATSPRGCSSRRLAVAAALAAVTVAGAAAAGIPVPATDDTRTSGDEPYYLLTALSLATDGDLDVSDEHADAAYRGFHEPTLSPQAARQPSGRMVVPHDPLLPALLAAPLVAAGWVGAKAALAGLAGGLAAGLVWVGVRRLGIGVATATATAVLLGASAPLAVYGTQVYPEIAAAGGVLLGVGALMGPLRRSGQLALLVAVVALPWLSIKYTPVAAALAALGLARLWREDRPRRAVALGAVLVLAGLAYLVAHASWYGGATVYAAGDFFQDHGGQTSVVGTSPDYLGRSTRLIGLMVDRTFGLAAWQPAWLLALPAVAALLRRRPAGWAALAAPLAAGWLVATFVAATMHGWWFPGRQTVVVLPLAALAIAWWADASRRRLVVVMAAGVTGVVTYGWLVTAGWQHRLTWVVDFAAVSGPHRLWRWALPAYQEPSTAVWVTHGAWLLAALFLAWWGWRARITGRAGDDAPPRMRPR